jgi:predicted O-methyltransferase YrrM
LNDEYKAYLDSVPEPAKGWLNRMVQGVWSGGAHTAPEMRMILLMLAIGSRARDILELGSDAGTTTEILALSGARVVGVDNWTEYPEVKPQAQELLKKYPNCTLVKSGALEYLKGQEDESWDLVFVDDFHGLEHVMLETVEVRRILRPGGFAVLHDTKVHKLWEAIEGYLGDWERINLPAISPEAGKDYGFGIARKPEK